MVIGKESEMIQAISDRRSIRKFKPQSVPCEMVENILKAGMLAPSSKNRQPWTFIVVREDARAEMLGVMEKGLDREETDPALPGSAEHLGAARYTLEIMKQAPVIIFIVNTLGEDIGRQLSLEERVYEICNAQSIGAAIENMTLTAVEQGLGSLWICDTFFAHRELCDWLAVKGELYAAMALGYADEAPSARPRKKMEDVVEWRE